MRHLTDGWKIHGGEGKGVENRGWLAAGKYWDVGIGDREKVITRGQRQRGRKQLSEGRTRRRLFFVSEQTEKPLLWKI